MDNQQIKIKELPIDWFVTDTYYQSGNKEFVSIEREQYTGIDVKTGCKMLKDLEEIPKEIFGTKHIQLIAANPTIKEWCNKCDSDAEPSCWNGNCHKVRDEVDYALMFWEYDDFFFGNLSIEEFEKNRDIIESGKDFFIYKVSKEK